MTTSDKTLKQPRAETTRRHLVEAAGRLLLEKGHRATTIGAILRETGHSRGAFYYHFGSKKAVLDAVVESLSREGLESLKEGVEAERGAVLRVAHLLGAEPGWWPSASGRLASRLSALYRSDSAWVREELERRSRDRLLPLLDRILRDGEEERAFRLFVPSRLVAEQILLSRGALLASQISELVGRAGRSRPSLYDVITRMDAFVRMTEGALGLENGSLGPAGREVMVRIYRALSAPTLGSAPESGERGRGEP